MTVWVVVYEHYDDAEVYGVYASFGTARQDIEGSVRARLLQESYTWYQHNDREWVYARERGPGGYRVTAHEVS